MSRINIQYIWVEHYKCLENAEFNFSTKYDIHYDKDTNTLSCEKNKNYIDGFFGENIDLTAIVGGNGAGKTTVLEMLTDSNTKFDYVIVCEDGDELKCSFSLYKSNKKEKIDTIKTNSNSKIKLISTCHKLSQVINHARSIPIVIISELIDKRNYYNSKNEIWENTFNLTSGGLLGKYNWLRPKYYGDSITSYFQDITCKQIDFACNYNDGVLTKKVSKDKVLPFDLRDKVNITIEGQRNEKCLETLVASWARNESDKKIKDSYVERGKDFLASLFREKKDKYSSLLEHNIFIDFHSRLCRSLFDSFMIDISLRSPFDKVGKDKKRIDDHPNLFNKLFFKDKSQLKFSTDHWLNMKILLEYYRDCLGDSQEESNIKKFAKIYLDYMQYIGTNKIRIEYDSERQEYAIPIQQIKKFFNEYQKVSENYDFLNFSWGYSSGEMAMFNLFSRFYSIKEKLYGKEDKKTNTENKKPENLLILIDEADMLYHPEWQQKYIKSLVEFLPTIYEGTHLQIILATHSPILLSDIPKQNVIYLKQGENGKTIVDPNSRHKESFGQNIFRLFNDAFFLEEGAMGDFAREKLEKLVERIHNLPNITNNYNAVYKAIQHEIDIIGDNFIREKLQAELEKYLDIPNRVQLLEEKMAEIQKQIDALSQQEKTKND